MNKTTLLFLLTLFLTQVCIAQLVISHKIDFEDKNQYHQLQTTRGDVLIGQLVGLENDKVYFQLLGLNDTISYHFTEVQTIWVRYDKRPNYKEFENQSLIYGNKPSSYAEYPTNQLLYSSTAFPYENDITYRNTMILWNQVDFKINDYLSAGGGVFVPAFLNIKAQANIPVTEYLHTGLAINHIQFLFSGEGSATHPYAMVSVGERSKYLSLSFGYWIRNGGFFFTPDPFPVLSLGGSYNFSNSWRFYFETMLTFEPNNQLVMPSILFSNFKRRRIIEFGLLTMPDSLFPILPVLGYSLLFK